MEFRARLLATLRAVAPILEVPGVLVVGSEAPNLFEPGAAATLVVSQDIDIAIPVAAHTQVKSVLGRLAGLVPSPDEPSVWLGGSQELLEVNFIGLDPNTRDSADTYVLSDPQLPLIVFGLLSLLRPGPRIDAGGLRVPLPRLAGLLLEKLATERSGEKGDRDLLVALGLLLVAAGADLEELDAQYRSLSPELRYTVRSNLTSLSLLAPRADMPDPSANRERVFAVLSHLETFEEPGQ